MRGFLSRAEMRKRKATTELKIRPTTLKIHEAMGRGKEIYTKMELDPKHVHNFDETAITYGIGPVHIYIPKSQGRAAQAPGTNVKARITAVVSFSGDGKPDPLMFIIRHSVKINANRPDQTNAKVISSLHKDVGFREEDGWQKITWNRSLAIDNITKEYKCIYLIHSEKGHVICSQHKAWNDTIRMAMYIDLIMKPLHDKNGGKSLTWADNCGCHKTPCIEALMKELGLSMALLPPNMTDVLQVIDLVVNGPIKQHIRTKRAERIVDYFKEYKVQFQANPNNLDLRKFNPPKATMKQGILDIINLFETVFSQQKFAEGVHRSFESTGMIPTSSINWAEYRSSTTSGYIKKEPRGSIDSLLLDIDSQIEVQEVIVQQAIDSYLDGVEDEDDDVDCDADCEDEDESEHN